MQKLEIEPCYIEKRQSWQSQIETQFAIQLRLADANSEHATALEETQKQHAAFVQNFNTNNHWAHRDQEDDLKTPVAVWAWQRGRSSDPSSLRRAFRHLQFPRIINRHGLVSVQRFYIFAHRGLARQRVSLWIYEDRLNIEYQQTLLARNQSKIERKRNALKSVSQPQFYPIPYSSPQLELFALDEAEWRRAWLRPPYVHRQVQGPLANNSPSLAWIFCFGFSLQSVS